MSSQERRWLDNIKKAFHDSDLRMREGQGPDCCIESLCKAVDTAKTLRLSLQGLPPTTSNHRKRFIGFLELEIPKPMDDTRRFLVKDSKSGTIKRMSVSEIVYEIRCMVHENENLNLAESCECPIRLDWSHSSGDFAVVQEDGMLVCNGPLLWRRLREILAKFITGIDAFAATDFSKTITVTIRPKLGAIVAAFF